jgi:hypothetical protein
MNGRVIMMKAALGMAFALVLASCAASPAPKVVYKRLDGRSIYSDPALTRQSEVDLATCQAFALNAGSQVYVPPPVQSQATNVYVNTAPGLSLAPTDFSGLGDIGAIIQRNREVSRRGDVEVANHRACMAERGYILEVVPQ